MTSLVDLLSGEKSRVGFKGKVTLVTPEGLSREERERAKDYLSGFKPEAVARHLGDNRDWTIKGSDIKTIVYTGNNPDEWVVLIRNSLFPFSSCGYVPRTERQEPGHATTASQAL